MAKRIWLITTAAIVAFGIIGGAATFALFSAASTPADSALVAGTVRLSGNRASDTVDGPMFYITPAQGASVPGGLPGLRATGEWAPGDSWTRAWQIQNTGSLDAKLMTMTTVLSGNEELAKALHVQVCEVNATPALCDLTELFSGSLWDLAQGAQPFAPAIELWPGDMITLYFKVSFDLAAGNALQGETVGANFQVYAEQVKHNP